MINVLEIVVGVVLILAALVITLIVLGQSSKNARHSGVIAGSAETFFGKSKGGDRDRKLNKLTLVIAIVFVVLVLAAYILQFGKARIDYGDKDAAISNAANSTVTTTVTSGTSASGTSASGTSASGTSAPETSAPETSAQ